VNYYAEMDKISGNYEFSLLVAGLGGKFENTSELHPMKLQKGMKGPAEKNGKLQL
jgi:hypothetical protein